MSYALCAAFNCQRSHRKTSEKIPDIGLNKALLMAPARAAELSVRPAFRRETTVECLATPCPKCNQRAIVQRSLNTFDCLNCDFHKRLPPIGARYPLRSPQLRAGGSASSLDGYELDGEGFENIDLGGTQLGQGSLSRHLATHRSLYTPPHETDAAQPILFAVIAVIIGILVL